MSRYTRKVRLFGSRPQPDPVLQEHKGCGGVPVFVRFGRRKGLFCLKCEQRWYTNMLFKVKR